MSSSSFAGNKKNKRGSGSANGSNSVNAAPPSPRRITAWIKLGGGSHKSRSMENIVSLDSSSSQARQRTSASPPLTLGGPQGVTDNAAPISITNSPNTPPKKVWEHNFRSFLSRRTQQPPLPAAPLIPPRNPQPLHIQHQPQQQQQQQQQPKKEKADDELDSSVRGGKFFQTVFHSHKSTRRKAKSMDQLDESLRRGVDKSVARANNSSSNNGFAAMGVAAKPDSLGRRTQSVANVPSSAADYDLDSPVRLGVATGGSAAAATAMLQNREQAFPLQQSAPAFPHLHYVDPSMPPPPVHLQQFGPPPSLNSSASPLHPYPPPHYAQPHQGLAYPFPPASSNSSYSVSPNSATTEIKKAFTEFHNGPLSADSTSAYLGDEPSGRHGRQQQYAMYNPAILAHGRMLEPASHTRQFSTGAMGIAMNNYHHPGSGNSSYRVLSSSLPTVEENVSIHKSMRLLRPFQQVDSWQHGKRYLIAPAALAACPLLQGTSSLSLKNSRRATPRTEQLGESQQNHEQDFVDGDQRKPQHCEENHSESQETADGGGESTMLGPAPLPPHFGVVVLGKALLSYVVQSQEPNQQQQMYARRWWSSAILVLRQNYLLEYDQQDSDVLRGLPRGYAHLQHSRSYANPDFVDALELEFFVSPCALADKRVLTIRLEEERERRDDWIACLNRAAQLRIKDMYDYDDSLAIGRGRYASVYPARRRRENDTTTAPAAPIDTNDSATPNGGEKEVSTDLTEVQEKMVESGYECALKIVNKQEFWKRVVKSQERADTIVREASVQATLTSKCAKMAPFVRIQGFFEDSENIVLEMDLLDGIDLFQYVSSKGVLAEPEAARILRDILMVLECMNRVGLAHRDIKPANILMTKSPSATPSTAAEDSNNQRSIVKVGDFGMSTFVGLDGLVRGRCGTPGYVAPEIFTAGIHGGYGNKVDIFSAGVTLYIMLCGYEPFYGESDAELVEANRKAKVLFPSNDWENVSAEAKDLVTNMMEANPSCRLSAKEALQHPWIIKHAGTATPPLRASAGHQDESCTIS